MRRVLMFKKIMFLYLRRWRRPYKSTAILFLAKEMAPIHSQISNGLSLSSVIGYNSQWLFPSFCKSHEIFLVGIHISLWVTQLLSASIVDEKGRNTCTLPLQFPLLFCELGSVSKQEQEVRKEGQFSRCEFRKKNKINKTGAPSDPLATVFSTVKLFPYRSFFKNVHRRGWVFRVFEEVHCSSNLHSNQWKPINMVATRFIIQKVSSCFSLVSHKSKYLRQVWVHVGQKL